MFKHLNLPRNVPEFVYRLVRGSLYSFTFILWVLGLSLILFSFWYIYEGENYHLDNSIKFCVFAVSFLIGSVLFSLALCGLVGVFKENLFLAKIFLVGIVLLMFVELTSIFLIYAYKHQILSHSSTLFQKFIKEYADDDDVRILVDTIQSDLKCCGISSPHDWDRNPYYKCNSISTFACSVPPSCCYNFTRDNVNMFCGVGVRRREFSHKQYQLIHVTGCKYSIHSFLDYKHKLTSSILTAVLVPQLIGVILIISYIITLNYLIELDSIENDYKVKFRRTLNVSTEIATACSEISTIAGFCEVIDLEADAAANNTNSNNKAKNLYLLNIGPNHDFLKKSSKYYVNRVFSSETDESDEEEQTKQEHSQMQEEDEKNLKY